VAAAGDPLEGLLGVCTDEVHPELEVALSFAREHGLVHVELLQFGGRAVVEMGEADWRRAGERIAAAGLRVSAVGSLCLKGMLLGQVRPGQVGAEPAFRREMQTLEASIRAAAVLGAPIVRCYGFRREGMVDAGNGSPRLPRGGEIPEEMLAKVAEGLGQAARRAAAAGLVLGLENVRSCWANTGYNTGRILAATGHPALWAMWDPANDLVSGGDPLGEGYPSVRGRICHVHVKDARVVDAAAGRTAWEAVGRGEVDWVGQFRALRRDGYRGPLSLETHWRLPEGAEPHRVEASRISLLGIRRALAASLEPAPPNASGAGGRP
jgi:L-ribulose-5-phosphate 3-epimerase